MITTIQQPTDCMSTLARYVLEHDLLWIVIGDHKGPEGYSLPRANFVSIEEQKKLPFKLARLLPEMRYARKNIGYLLAMASGCDSVYETDDDNVPNECWKMRSQEVEGFRIQPKTNARWANVYNAYTREVIWPRGFPLSMVNRHLKDDFEIPSACAKTSAMVQQGLANGSPDVDAIWRLVFNRDVQFGIFPSLIIPPGIWCPFNSQNTWWWRDAFPLMYLPSYCSWRMCDIWRSFVAQRCMWELGCEVEFHCADVIQIRNVHNFMRDFEEEVTGYLRNEEIATMLESCNLRINDYSDLKEGVFRCYEVLVREKVVGSDELHLVEAWLADCP